MSIKVSSYTRTVYPPIQTAQAWALDLIAFPTGAHKQPRPLCLALAVPEDAAKVIHARLGVEKELRDGFVDEAVAASMLIPQAIIRDASKGDYQTRYSTMFFGLPLSPGGVLTESMLLRAEKLSRLIRRALLQDLPAGEPFDEEQLNQALWGWLTEHSTLLAYPTTWLASRHRGFSVIGGEAHV